ncbi:MAG: DUF3859 domain-containing protein [Rhizomicrobium sp.]|nr:DUF3859 domain-containing protein [Rhizomicrobium sp.]
MKNIVTVIALGALLTGCASVREREHVAHVDVLNYGIYSAKVTSNSPAPTVAIGKFDWASNARIVKATSTIDAKLGLRFGFDFQPTGEPDGSMITVTVVTIFPAPGLKNGDTAAKFAREAYKLDVPIGEPTTYFYTFEKDWEIVCGRWQFQVWYNGNKFAQQNFDVVSSSCHP